MASLTELMALQDMQIGRGKAFSNLEILNEQAKEKKKQQNIKDQMSQFQKLTEQMNQMPDNSSTGKAVSLTGDKVKQSRVGSVGATTMIPTREVTMGNDGINVKFGFKSASPQDQKSLIDVENSKRQMEIDQQKRDFITGYIKGEIPEGAFIQEVGNLGLTDKDFEMATQARSRLQSIQQRQIPMASQVQPTGIEVPEGYQVSAYEPSAFGTMKPKSIIPISAQDKKAQMEIADVERKNQLQSDMVKTAAKDTIDTIAEVKKGISNFGLTGGLPSIPGTERANWEANTNKLLSKKIVDLMNEMKQASKTGATGFGALSEKELKVLQSASTALNRGLSPKDAERYLNEMESLANKVLGGDVQSSGWNQTSTGIKYKVVE